MAVLSRYARERKLRLLSGVLSSSDRVLEVGAGSGWLKARLAGRVARYDALDLVPPADFVGDVRRWRELGLAPASYDAVIACEVVEHAPCWDEVRDLLKPGGLFFATSPAPEWDWLCRALEAAGLSQARTSPHDHLVDFAAVRGFEPVRVERFFVLSQWGLFRKPRG